MGLPGREVRPRRVAPGIDQGVDLRAQPAATAPNGLAGRLPLSAFRFPLSRAVLVRSHDSQVNRRAFVVRFLREPLEQALPHPDLLQRENRVCALRKSPKHPGKSGLALPDRYLWGTPSTNRQLSRAVIPT